jgi:redox-sensitive bicupin YhaK (pirin superfamily)
MFTIRPAAERGSYDHGWLKTHHSFSFADYYDPRHMGFGPLRVINDDTVAAGAGFGTHGHRDMEIISYVLSGELAHQDSLGNGSVIRPGNVQRMSAGTGVRHSEFNHAADAPTHFLQIWIEPDRTGIAPGYEERNFSDADKRGRLRLIASPDGAAGSVTIHQDARVYAGLFDGEEADRVELVPGRRAYVHVARGQLEVNGHTLGPGDGARLEHEADIAVRAGHQAEVLVFDLP